MTQKFERDPVQELFIFTVKNLLEQMVQAVQEKTSLEPPAINNILNIIQTIKGSSGMTIYTNINSLAHSAEDLFCYLQENQAAVDFVKLADIVLKIADFIKAEINKLENGKEADGKEQELIIQIDQLLADIKAVQQDLSYQADIYFEEGCEMENVRAFSVVHNITQVAREITHIPEDIDSSEASKEIQQNGFHLCFKSALAVEDLHKLFEQTPFLKSFTMQEEIVKPEAVKQIILDNVLPENEPEPEKIGAETLSPQKRKEGATSMATAEEPRHVDTQSGKFLTFSVGSEYYGIEIKYVKEIIGGIQAITEVPELPEYVKGIINLRGTIIPVMDIRLRFKKAPKDYNDRTCIVVVHIRDILIGLIVDAVAEVLAIPEQDIVSPPTGHNSFHNRYIKGIGKVGNDVKLLLDCNMLINDDELESFTNI